MLSKCTIHIIIHRKERWLQKLWLMFLTANDKNCQQQKVDSFLSQWQALLLFWREGLKFHSVVYNDWFFPIVKHRGHLIINSVSFSADMGKRNGWINLNAETSVGPTVISLLKLLTMTINIMRKLRPFGERIVPNGQKLDDSILF